MVLAPLSTVVKKYALAFALFSEEIADHSDRHGFYRKQNELIEYAGTARRHESLIRLVLDFPAAHSYRESLLPGILKCKRVVGDWTTLKYLQESHRRCVKRRLLGIMPEVLYSLARLEHLQGSPSAAKRSALKARCLAERRGHRLRAADGELLLAHLDQEEDWARAIQHAVRAQALAYCDGDTFTYDRAYRGSQDLIRKLTDDTPLKHLIATAGAGRRGS